jgi:hypothetical protein
LRIEQEVPDQVKAIAKNTLGGSLMFFDANGFDHMEPRTDMVRPAKRHGDHGKETF